MRIQFQGSALSHRATRADDSYARMERRGKLVRVERAVVRVVNLAYHAAGDTSRDEFHQCRKTVGKGDRVPWLSALDRSPPQLLSHVKGRASRCQRQRRIVVQLRDHG